MKLQYLAVIFIIIIMPIVMVLSQYIDYHIDAINLRHTYDTKLLNSTYDSIKAYQLNTVNNAISDIPAAKIEGLEAAVNAFFNSLTTNFNYSGYNSGVMKEYVPAVVFTMYDGYYIYSPYENVLTGVPRTDGTDAYVEKGYEDHSDTDDVLHGIKPYIYYSCRYKNKPTDSKEFDIVITYTLDNYITIQGYVEGNYINEHGYLIDGIKSIDSGDTDGEGNVIYNYEYDGVLFKHNGKEELKEYLGDKQYPYAKLNGTKYYLDEKAGSNDEIFYINATGEKAIPYKEKDNTESFNEFKDFIINNNSAYRYYKEAYKITQYVHKILYELTADHAVDVPSDYFSKEPIFGEDDGDNKTGKDGITALQDSDSNFNDHRSAIIRYTIEKNLATAITGFKKYSKAENVEFIMPKISDTDWATLENNVSIITFLQGFNIAGRDYNKYCVVANNLTKEYVDENDIYILGKDGMYYKSNDITLNNSNIKSGTESGIWKLNFERKKYRDVIDLSDDNYKYYYYYPIGVSNYKPYLGSYSSIINSTSVDTSEPDLYKYMRNSTSSNLKETYYTALARERWGQYSVNNNIDIVQGNILNTNTSEIFHDDSIEEITLVAKYKDSSGNYVTLEDGKWTKNDVKLIGTAKDTESNILRYLLNQESGEPSAASYIQNFDADITYEEEIKNKNSGEHTYYFHAKDGSGNIGLAEKTIHIDKTNPIIKELKKETEEDWVKSSVTVTATIQDEHSGIANYTITNSSSTPSNYENNISPTTREIKLQQEFFYHGTYYLHIKDQAGNTTYQKIEVNNIDNVAPIVTVTPKNAQICKNTQITIKITDDFSGVQLNQNGEFNGEVTLTTMITGVTDEGKETEVEAKEYYDYKAKMNEQGELEATLTIGGDLTGVYKLYIGGDIFDRAGNVTEEELVGEFIFDNRAPAVKLQYEDGNDNENKTVGKNQNIIITLSDEPAGLTSNQGVCYLSTSSEQNTKTKQYNYTSGETINIGGELNGRYYIWIDSVSDKLGNATGEILIGELVFDNEAPVVKVTPISSGVCKNTDITITLSDELSGLSSNDGICYLSTSSTTNTKTKQYNYISGQSINIGNNMTGTYYLWVGDVLDKAENVNREHYVGSYIFDNTAPTISYFRITENEGTDVGVETGATDVGAAGIASYKYFIRLVGGKYQLASEHRTTNTVDTYRYDENLSAGGKYEVYVVVTDSVGNSTSLLETHNPLDIEFYRIRYNFNVSRGEKLYDQIIKDENEFSSTTIEELHLVGRNATVYSKEAVKLNTLTNRTFSLRGWTDNKGNNYDLYDEYTGNRDITLFAIWQLKSIRLPLDSVVNVNLYWDYSDIDIDTHTYTYNSSSTQLHQIYYGNKKLGTAIQLDRDDRKGGTGENTLMNLGQIVNNYSSINKIIMRAKIYSGASAFKVVPNLKVIITNRGNNDELFSYDLTQVDGSLITVGTITKGDGYWLFEGGDSSITY